jgi:ABC-type lipoprotein export system ATPase subunit
VEPVLEVQAVAKTFAGPDGPVPALRDFSLAGGLLRPDAGSVRLAGEDLYGMNAGDRAAFRARHIGFIFQEFYLLPYLSVSENVLTPALAQTIRDIEKRARAILDQLGLATRANHKPDALSTGERQRVALARALLPRPSLLLADEPTGNLDKENAETVAQVFRTFAANGGAVLMVTHNDHVAQAAQRTVALNRS